jgi:oligoendopeptidase F
MTAPVWDLSALFSGIDDPKIEATWADLHKRAATFEKVFRGKIDSVDLDSFILLEALKENERIATEASKPINYAQLLYSADTSNPALGAFLGKQMEQASALGIKLIFFDLELMAANEVLIEKLLQMPELENYRHYVHHARAFAPHRLKEDQEVILEEVANTGSRAWVRLFEEVTANHVFEYTSPSGEAKDLSQEEVLSLIREPDRAVRQAAADAFSQGLTELERVLVFTYNNLLQDKAVEDRLRKLQYPEEARHLSNELTKTTVDMVMRLCREHYSLVARFYHVKREILGLPELTHVDRYAPLFHSEAKVPFEEAKKIVLDAFGRFNETLAAKAEEFFDKQWIDAEARKGKRGGAYCSYNTPDTHPVVFMNYLDKSDDVMTLAHELGHGVHASLSRAQTYFNFHGTLPLAELASTFGEMLVFESLVEHADTKEKLALYAEKIEGVFATVFRQSAMFRFEQRAHETRRAEGELPAERFAEIWQEELQAMFGDSLTLGEQHRRWWSYVSHFIAVPFYVYAYSFGELLVLSLYQKAKEIGPSFGPKYIELLEKGGSETPVDLMASVGIDLNSEEFWLGGFAALESIVAEFEKLWASSKS